MDGKEYLKHAREKKNISIREIAFLCGISPRTISSYENGEKNISSMPVKNALKYFSYLGVNIESFFSEYFPYKNEVNQKKIDWCTTHHREYNVALLKKRYYERLAKIKERNSDSSSSASTIDFCYLISLFISTFNVLCKSEYITDNEYDRYILKLNQSIRIFLHPLPASEIQAFFVNSIYLSDYSLVDIASFCDVSRYHLRKFLTDSFDIFSIHISFALKLCCLFNFSFANVFLKGEVFNG